MRVCLHGYSNFLIVTPQAITLNCNICFVFEKKKYVRERAYVRAHLHSNILIVTPQASAMHLCQRGSAQRLRIKLAETKKRRIEKSERSAIECTICACACGARVWCVCGVCVRERVCGRISPVSFDH